MVLIFDYFFRHVLRCDFSVFVVCIFVSIFLVLLLSLHVDGAITAIDSLLVYQQQLL